MPVDSDILSSLQSVLAKEEEDVEQFEHQVAGHRTHRRLQHDGRSFVLKPCGKVALFERERAFYSCVQGTTRAGGMDLVSGLIPRCLGVVSLRFRDSDAQHLVLEDLTQGRHSISVIDVKIGRCTHEPSADVEKVLSETRKYQHQHEVGFRISGMKVYHRSSACHSTFDKNYGRSLAPDQVVSALAAFFHDGVEFRADVVRRVIPQLERIASWFELQVQHHFFCSSILIVYDPSLSDSIPFVRVGMIDFAHVLPQKEAAPHADGAEIDVNYLYGIHSLISRLRTALE